MKALLKATEGEPLAHRWFLAWEQAHPGGGALAALAGCLNQGFRYTVAKHIPLDSPLIDVLVADSYGAIRVELALRLPLESPHIAALAVDPYWMVRRALADRFPLTSPYIARYVADPDFVVRGWAQHRIDQARSA